MKPINAFLDADEIMNAAQQHWRWIWQQINYVPIFQLAENVIERALCSRQLSAYPKKIKNRQVTLWKINLTQFNQLHYSPCFSTCITIKCRCASNWGTVTG